MKNSQIGEHCRIGQNVVIGPEVVIGNNVKIQNNVSVYSGVTLEDDVFCGPTWYLPMCIRHAAPFHVTRRTT